MKSTTKKISLNGRDRLLPDFTATGDHCKSKRDFYGQVVKYSIFVRNDLNPTGFDEVFLYHSMGRKHYDKSTGEDVDTPHVHYDIKLKKVRKPTKDEIPN